MAVTQFAYFQGLPTVLVTFQTAKPRADVVRRLLVDSGFTGQSGVVLAAADAARLRRRKAPASQVAGALVGAHERVWIKCSIPALGFTANLMAISGDLDSLSLPAGIDGLVGLSFLNHFRRWGAERLADDWVFVLESA